MKRKTKAARMMESAAGLDRLKHLEDELASVPARSRRARHLSAAILGDSVLSYETQIKAGKFVVVAHGTRDELAKGRAVLAGATQYEGKAHSCCA